MSNSAGAVTSSSATLTINKANQTITFDALAVKSVGDVPFTLNATATSGLALSYASSNPSVATISGNTVTIVGAGTATITASQAGNADFGPAANVEQTLTVNKAVASIALTGTTATYDGQPKTVTATTTPAGLSVVAITYNGETIAPTNAGSYGLSATLTHANYTGSATGTLVIAKAGQSIAFPDIGQKVFTDGTYALNATGGASGEPVTYTSSDPAVATVSGSTVTFLKTGSTTITANQAGNANYNAASAVQRVLTIVPAIQTITFAAIDPRTFDPANNTFTLAATAVPSGLPVSYASSDETVATVSASGTVTILKAGFTDITASQAGNDNFGPAAPIVQRLTVNKATATISILDLAANYNGNPQPVTTFPTPTGLTVNVTYQRVGSSDTPSSTAPTNAGSYNVVASIVSDRYQGSATATLVISKAAQTITFAGTELAGKTFGDASVVLTASTTSSLPIAFASSEATVAAVAGNSVTILTGGTTTITASQAGNENYEPAAPVSHVMTIAKATGTVVLTDLAHVYNGSVKGAGATTGPELGLAVSFTYLPVGSSGPPTTTAPSDAGSYTVTGTMADPRYAATASATMVIAKAPQTIDFPAIPAKALDDDPFTVTATATSTLPVTFASSDVNVATINATTGAVTLVGTGTTTITASIGESANFLAATDQTQTLTVSNASQSIDFAALAARTFAPNEAITISATAKGKTGNATGLLVSFASSNATIATVGTSTLDASGVSSATITVLAAGTTTITASQAGSSNFAAAPSVPRDLVIDRATSTIALTPATLSQVYNAEPRVVTATTDPAGLNVVFTYGSGATASSTPPINAGTYPVIATIEEPNYKGTVSGELVVAKADQTITFPIIASPKLINAPAFALEAATTSPLEVTYTSSNSAVATITGNTVTVVGLGTTTLTAKQAGNENYNPATELTQTLVVNPLAPIITSTPPTTVVAIQGSNFVFGPIGVNPLSASPDRIFSLTGAPSVPTGLAVNATSGVISGVPSTSGSTPGAYTLTLTVSNATGSDSKTINLTLQPPAPVFTSPASVNGTVAAAFSYTVVATNAASYTLSGTLPTGLTFANGVISGTPQQSGSFSVTITATNATGSVTLPLMISIALPPDAPSYVGTLTPSGTAGTAFSFATNFGPGTGTTYQLTGAPTGMEISAAGVISWPTPTLGTHTVTVSATRSGVTTSAELSITVNSAPQAPAIAFGTGGNIRSAVFNQAISAFTLTTTPAAPAATFTATGLPPGVTIDAATGVVSGTPTAIGTFTAIISATSSNGTGPGATLIITVHPNPDAPVVTSAPIVTGPVGVQLDYQLTSSATGTSAAATTYAVVGTLPDGLTLTAATGLVSGIPTAAAIGSHSVHFAATNSNGTGLALAVTFIIAPPLTVPVINSNGTASGQAGQSFNYTITATNGPTAFAATNLPAGLEVNTATGVISGVPSSVTPVGTPASVTLTASNADGASNPKTLLISIAPAPATPVITSALSANARVGVVFAHQVTASQSPTSYASIGLPPGLRLDAATGMISGTPMQSAAFDITLRAANAAGLGAPATFALNVAPALTAPTITSAAAVSGKVGVAFSYQTVATPSPITSYAVAGTLPVGLALNTSTGVISGTPTAAGVTIVSLTATGAGGTSQPQALTLNIAPSDNVPVITSPGAANGTVGQNFVYTITATNVGSGPPYAPSVTLDAAGLPSGLAVNPSTGAIQGHPTSVGVTVASLVGTNANGTGPARALTITVQPAATAPVVNSATVASGQVGTGFGYMITATNSPTSFEVLDAPAWMTINSATGALAGTPTAPGSIQVRLVAANSAGSSTPVPLTINLVAAAGTPIVTSSLTAAGRVGTPFAGYQITAAPAATSYVATGLPPGLALNAATGAITGTPTSSGNYPVSISGSNALGAGTPVIVTFQIATSASIQ